MKKIMMGSARLSLAVNIITIGVSTVVGVLVYSI